MDGFFIQTEGPFQRLDPRTKIFILLYSFILLILYQHPSFVFAIFLLVLLNAVSAKCLKNIRIILPLLIIITFFSIVLWSFYGKGRTELFFKIYLDPFLYGLSTALKIDGMMIAGIIFLSTTKNEEIVLGLKKLGIPYSVSFAISMAIRMVPTITNTVSMVIQAQEVRGLRLKEERILKRIKNYIPLMVPIFLNIIRNANYLSMALESKGFGMSKKRTYYLEIEIKKWDLIVIIFLSIFLIANIFLRIQGYGVLEGIKF